jgi:site-specific DNA-methyltransferase (adenine-specific)
MILCESPEIDLQFGDCLDLMPLIPDKSIDMILADLPYGTTACKWDVIIPFEPLWKQYKRIIKDNGAIVLTASQPFTSMLVMSNVKDFKFEMIWFKDRASGFLNSLKRPMPNHEDILIYYSQQPTYNPQKYQGDKSHSMGKTANTQSRTKVYGDFIRYENTDNMKMPKTVLYYPIEFPQIHNTQKPVKLFEYLIRTYTNEGETVLDNVAGSGTTAIACYNLNRRNISMEKDDKYFEVARKRISNHVKQLTLNY